MAQSFDTSDIVRKLFLETLQVSDDVFSPDLGPGDIPEWDSLANVNLIQTIEAHFNISFDITDVFAIESISDIIDLVKEYRGE